MTRIYDIVVDNRNRTIVRYGKHYKLENISRMGEQRYYTYKAAGLDTLIVVPYFRVQWNEANKIIKDITNGMGESNDLSIYSQIINEKCFSGFRIEDTTDADGMAAKMIVARYKDIDIEIEINEQSITLQKIFTIRDNNIFGNDVVVDFQEGKT